MRKTGSKAAYFLVDVNELPEEHRADLIEDALAGGGEYGLKVVEEAHNGAARQPIFGVYYDVKKADGTFRIEPQTGLEIGNDETKWNAAKAEFGLDAEAIEADEDGEEALRQSSAAAAEAEAERVRAAEEAELEAITNPDSDTGTNKAKRARH